MPRSPTPRNRAGTIIRMHERSANPKRSRTIFGPQIPAPLWTAAALSKLSKMPQILCAASKRATAGNPTTSIFSIIFQYYAYIYYAYIYVITGAADPFPPFSAFQQT
ncbi:MAG: hypothetical protein C3F11_11655 [Methylocystaceae bacterium]|nr:MAG: hypothetical protein C3F11_11655 [Methylocystaceae bacterium]